MSRADVINVIIPMGIDDGDVVGIGGKGEDTSPGIPAGDLHACIRVQQSHRYVRDGLNVLNTVAVDMVTAALGGSVKVHTVHGLMDIDVPAGTQPNSILRMRGKGIKNHEDREGDHLSKVEITIPKDLNPQQVEALKMYQQL